MGRGVVEDVGAEEGDVVWRVLRGPELVLLLVVEDAPVENFGVDREGVGEWRGRVGRRGSWEVVCEVVGERRVHRDLDVRNDDLDSDRVGE